MALSIPIAEPVDPIAVADGLARLIGAVSLMVRQPAAGRPGSVELLTPELLPAQVAPITAAVGVLVATAKRDREALERVKAGAAPSSKDVADAVRVLSQRVK